MSSTLISPFARTRVKVQMPCLLHYHSDAGPELGNGVTGQRECPTVYACIHKDNILTKTHTHTLLCHTQTHPPRAPEVPLGVNLIVLQ